MQNGQAKERIVLSENREKALIELLDPKPRKNKADEEIKYFQLYLNYAVANIQEIAGISVTDEKKIFEALEKKNDAEINKLAHFLWLFNVDEPENCFNKEKNNLTLRNTTYMLTEKIFALRNLFAHTSGKGINAFLSSLDFYVLLEGILLGISRDNAASKGLQTDKLFKLKLMNKHSDLKPSDILFEKDKQFELTRKGLIFLTCMGLYREQAMEFCQQFADMKLPQKCPASTEDCQTLECPAQEAKKCNYAKAKALIEMFTFFSIRKGRTDINAANLDYMCFSDIMTYLNKVPVPAFDYLSLDAEKVRLQKLYDASKEENKIFKYTLHKRFKDRFLSFAAAYCEDFNCLPVLRFKRLDISDIPGRKRYVFGTENDNRNRMDRHYCISKKNIQFEFLPQEHYGDIKIKSLRSSISESEFLNILFVGEKFGYDKVNSKLAEYFTAYHKILEIMLNTSDNEFDLEALEQDFCQVANISADELWSEDFSELLKPFFSENILRFFFDGDDDGMTQEDLKEQLSYRLNILSRQAHDFIMRWNKFNKWRRTPKENRSSEKPPVCENLAFGPKNCKVSDAELVKWVFKAFNLHLDTDKKFRQLPIREQHNKGNKDFEYQIFHAAIGKYSLDPKGLAVLIERQRPELKEVYKNLTADVEKYLSEERKYLKHNPRFDANGKPLNARATLMMLGKAAANYYQNYCEGLSDKYEAADAYDYTAEFWQKECRRFGIRPGMTKSYNSLVKTILGIDIDQWSHAYNYAENKPYANRTLACEEHIVSQIPLPNGFVNRLFADERREALTGLINENNLFSVIQAFRNRFKTDIKLRDYYNVSPLTLFTQGKGKDGVNCESNVNYSKNAVNKAKQEINKYFCQDNLLLSFAFKYRQRALENENAIDVKITHEKGNDIYEYFNTPDILKTNFAEEKIIIKIFPNDITRPIFSNVKKQLKKICKYLPSDDKEYDFYELQQKYQDIQNRDRNKRLEIMPQIIRIENAVKLPDLDYKNKTSQEIRDMEFPYYKQMFKNMTREDFDIIADIRNEVYHDGFDLDITEAQQVLKKNLKILNRR